MIGSNSFQARGGQKGCLKARKCRSKQPSEAETQSWPALIVNMMLNRAPNWRRQMALAVSPVGKHGREKRWTREGGHGELRQALGHLFSWKRPQNSATETNAGGVHSSWCLAWLLCLAASFRVICFVWSKRGVRGRLWAAGPVAGEERSRSGFWAVAGAGCIFGFRCSPLRHLIYEGHVQKCAQVAP